MSVRSAQPITVLFETRGTGGSVDADSLPTGTLYLNGASNGATVTVTHITTGLYKSTVTLPTLAVTDRVEIVISATVSSISEKKSIWGDSCDVLQEDTAAKVTTDHGAGSYVSDAGPVDANVVSMADGTINENTITVPTEVTGFAAGILAKIQGLYNRFQSKSHYDKVAGTVTSYKSDGTTLQTTQAVTVTSTDEYVGKAS